MVHWSAAILAVGMIALLLGAIGFAGLDMSMALVNVVLCVLVSAMLMGVSRHHRD